MASGTGDAVGPAQSADGRKAFGVINEGLHVYHAASIAYRAMRDKSHVKDRIPQTRVPLSTPWNLY
jgi:hypothetical protein